MNHVYIFKLVWLHVIIIVIAFTFASCKSVLSNNSVKMTIEETSTLVLVQQQPVPPIPSNGIYKDFQYNQNSMGYTITHYNGPGGVIEIPAEINGIPVTIIGDNAFSRTSFGSSGDLVENSGKIISVTIPDSVISIGTYAFYGNSLTSVVIPDNVASIGDWAFYDNPITGNLALPNGLTSIGHNAFSGNRLTSIIIPDSVYFIGESAFDSYQLTSITIGANIHIPSTAFMNIDRREGRITYFKESNFWNVYNSDGRLAGTYNRPNANSTSWTRQ